jgi:oligo-1,6-glucosidase
MLKKWWKEGVVYQIYPRSFKDSNNDGIGDIRGIIEKIDYLKDLGVSILWLNPVYKSPNDDNGYDISDYQDIMDEFGTMNDWQELLDKLHQNDIKMIMDLVVNHTSDEHRWFEESRKSKNNPYRDYYIWRPGKNGGPPNNWKSVFGGSAWEYDERTGEYYLHLFTRKQPDLNWENPELRKEIYKMMNWWLDKGIDGFRMDVINMISKPQNLMDLPDASLDGYTANLSAITNGPRVHEFIQEMCRETVSRYDVMTVGETPGTSLEQALDYVDQDRSELNMVIQFEHVEIDYGPQGRFSVGEWSLTQFKDIFTRWQNKLHNKGWNCIYLMNHDQSRSLSRYADDKPEFREPAAKMLATFLLSLEGTPFIYQGEEIGMTNVAFNSIEDYKDIETLNYYKEAKARNINEQEIMKNIHFRSRDNSRTPIQWDNSKNAGFSEKKPWIRVNPNYKEINVADTLNNKDSIFYYYKKMIKLRKETPVLIYGEYRLLDQFNEDVYSYKRILEDEKALFILNFKDKNVEFASPLKIQPLKSKLLISNYTVDTENIPERMILKPFEARVYLYS